MGEGIDITIHQLLIFAGIIEKSIP